MLMLVGHVVSVMCNPKDRGSLTYMQVAINRYRKNDKFKNAIRDLHRKRI
jgi:hypothetical protein